MSFMGTELHLRNRFIIKFYLTILNFINTSKRERLYKILIAFKMQKMHLYHLKFSLCVCVCVCVCVCMCVCV